MVSKLTATDQDKLRHLSRNGAPNKQLMQIFGVSLSTVERYKFDHLRELSRSIQRNRNKSERVCYRCGMFKSFHERCSVCEILVHNGKGKCDEHLSKS